MAPRTKPAVNRKACAMTGAHAEKRQEILIKAREVFAKYGYRKTAIEDVGRACGLAGPAIYYYFSGKEELFAETIRAFGEMEIEQLRQACFASTDPKRQLIAFVQFAMKSMQEFTRETQLSDVAAILPQAMKAGESCHRARQALLEEILSNGQRQGVFRKLKTERTAAMLMSFVGGAALERLRKPSASEIEDDVALLASLWLDGVCK